MAGGVDYFTHCSGKGDHDLYIDEQAHHETGYLTDLLSRRAVDYVQSKTTSAKAGKPFFLSLHYTAPHWPWETREDAHLAEQVKGNLFHLDGGSIHTYHRMIQHMDEGIGWLVDALRSADLLDNTLIVFTSDNGGERFSDNWPLVGGKMDLTEGGIRVPWIAHWPAVIAPASVSAQPCMTMDWSATLLALGGGSAHPDYPIDGISLEPVLRQPSETFERPLYWRMNHRHQRAFRLGGWKYLTSANAPTWPSASPSGCRPCARPGSIGRRPCPPFPKTRLSAWATPAPICRSAEGPLVVPALPSARNGMQNQMRPD
jgi:arylsulfatase A-like enzyme